MENLFHLLNSPSDRRAWFGTAVLAPALLLALLLAGPGPRPFWRPAVAPRGQAPVVHPANWIDPDGIVFHSSDSPSHVGRERVDEECIDEMHATDHPRWTTEFEGKAYHIGYHYVILPDGTIQQGRPDHCIGAHARHYNHWLGICLVGEFISSRHPAWRPRRPTRAQLRSLIVLSERLVVKYHIPMDHIKRHCDVNPRQCPGKRFPYAYVMAKLRSWDAARTAAQRVEAGTLVDHSPI